MTIADEPVGASKVLRTATRMLKLLNTIEAEMTGKKAAIDWETDIMTSPSRAIIKLSEAGGRGSKLAFDTAAGALAAMKRRAGEAEG
jgi:hypothetical protein